MNLASFCILQYDKLSTYGNIQAEYLDNIVSSSLGHFRCLDQKGEKYPA